MTTVFDISLQVAKEAQDVLEGTATGGSTTTLIDSVLLAKQPADYFNNGRLWIKSGTHADKVWTISDFALGGTVTFAAVTGEIVAGVRYAIVRNLYPWDQIVSAIQRALENTWVTGHNATLTGDGATLDFTLPSGVYNVLRVENTRHNVFAHWTETMGILRFSEGYEPDDTLHVYYQAQHDDLVDGTSVISNEINLTWLKYAAAQELLYWGVGVYGSIVEYRIEERMNKIINALKGKNARREISIQVRTA
jgi:hypothetical protein